MLFISTIVVNLYEHNRRVILLLGKLRGWGSVCARVRAWVRVCVRVCVCVCVLFRPNSKYNKR